MKEEKNDKQIIIKTRAPLLVKEEAEYIFNNLGLDMNTAINMFLEETVLDKNIPLKIHKHPNKELLKMLKMDEPTIPKNQTKPISCYTLRF